MTVVYPFPAVPMGRDLDDMREIAMVALYNAATIWRETRPGGGCSADWTEEANLIAATEAVSRLNGFYGHPSISQMLEPVHLQALREAAQWVIGLNDYHDDSWASHAHITHLEEVALRVLRTIEIQESILPTPPVCDSCGQEIHP